LRRWRRPFFDLILLVEMPPSNDWIAERTSCCTMSRMTVTRLLCLGIESLPLSGARYTKGRSPAKAVRSSCG